MYASVYVNVYVCVNFSSFLDPMVRWFLARRTFLSAYLFACADDLAVVLSELIVQLRERVAELSRWELGSGLGLKPSKRVVLPAFPGPLAGHRVRHRIDPRPPRRRGRRLSALSGSRSRRRARSCTVAGRRAQNPRRSEGQSACWSVPSGEADVVQHPLPLHAETSGLVRAFAADFPSRSEARHSVRHCEPFPSPPS